jgi:hypothetical protein
MRRIQFNECLLLDALGPQAVVRVRKLRRHHFSAAPLPQRILTRLHRTAITQTIATTRNGCYQTESIIFFRPDLCLTLDLRTALALDFALASRSTGG